LALVGSVTDPGAAVILCVNCGSSSVKCAVYELGPGREEQLAASSVDGSGPDALAEALGVGDPYAAALTGAGHRIVHGGPHHFEPARIDDALLADLRAAVPFAPLHLPAALAGIDAVTQRHPSLPQVACFDTAFHRTLPEAARVFALPRRFTEQGIVRYGFHGLSYEYIVEELGKGRCDGARQDRVIIAHLGNGASMAAVHCGLCIDTTMGFTPTGGLVMGTRSGDLDPGALLYLLTQEKLTPDELARVVNHDGGMLGISGVSPDMRELLQQAQTNPKAALAVEIFCYQARKFIGALTAALGGLETLVFTAGIGEKAPPVREEICARLDWLGVRLDAGRNAGNEPVISADDSRVRVLVMKTNEELMIARHTARVLAG
jgi:acetate kinase